MLTSVRTSFSRRTAPWWLAPRACRLQSRATNSLARPRSLLSLGRPVPRWPALWPPWPPVCRTALGNQIQLWSDDGTGVVTITEPTAGHFAVFLNNYTYNWMPSGEFVVTVNDYDPDVIHGSGAPNVTLPALTTNGVTLHESVGVLFGPVTIATFTDPGNPTNTNAPPYNEYSATINWADGTTDPGAGPANNPVTIVYAGGGVWDVEGSHTYATVSTFPVVVTITETAADGSVTPYVVDSTVSTGNSLTGSSSATGTGGVEYTTAAILGNATFTDSIATTSASAFSVQSVNWGDSTSSTAGLTITGSNGSFQVNGSHVYAEEGTYHFSIVVTGVDGTAMITGSATVVDAPLTGESTATATGGVEYTTVATLSGATFTDANLAAPSSDFSVQSVAWGDGGTSSAGLSISGSGGTYTVSGTHQYAEEGTYNFTITVLDDGGSTAMIHGSTTVVDASLTGESTATATGGVEYTTPAALSAATFTDANLVAPSSDFSVESVTWGDGGTSTAGLTISGSGGSYTVSGTHQYAEEGTYDFTITVLDDGGSTATIHGSTTVGDAPLTGEGTATATGGVEYTTPATLSGATFTDANLAAPSSDFSVQSVAWGDGGTSTAGLTISGSGGTYTVSGAPVCRRGHL